MLLDKFKMQGQVLEIADTWVRNELSTLTAADIPYNDSNVGAELDDINNELSSLDASDVSYNSSNVGAELDDINEDINTINSDLSSKQDSIAQGVVSGNIDNVGLAGGVPIGLCWCHSTNCTGTLPFNAEDDVYFNLLTLIATAGVIVQLCMPYSYNYNMAIRMYVNGAWTVWQQIG